jgi:hypothetical protein
MPSRIRFRRTKGWRMPEGAIYVGRPSRWGNPIVASGKDTRARREAIERFKALLAHGRRPGDYPTDDEIRRELAGHDLVCWCPLDQPCHADVLLELANRSHGSPPTG